MGFSRLEGIEITKISYLCELCASVVNNRSQNELAFCSSCLYDGLVTAGAIISVFGQILLTIKIIYIFVLIKFCFRYELFKKSNAQILSLMHWYG